MARILVIDENKRARKLLALTLKSEGHDVHQAADAAAIRACRGGGVDLLVCDLFMPGQRGLEAIYELRLLFPELKVVATGGGSNHGGRMDFLGRLEGADAVLRMPFNRQGVLEAVDAALAAAESARPVL